MNAGDSHLETQDGWQNNAYFRPNRWHMLHSYVKRPAAMPTVVVDTGSGNLRSVEKAAETAVSLSGRAGAVVRSSDPDVIRTASRLILPGQGAFGDGARVLQTGIGAAVLEFIRSGKPFFGICIGLQLLFETSEEAPGVRGLGYFRGEVRRLQGGLGIKIPHMGWNALQLETSEPTLLTVSKAAQEYFYFVHSFHAVPSEPGVLLATVEYGNNHVTAAVGRDNVFATQFHPEKSQRMGLTLLSEFFKQ
jgi:glutamine amidotransferase